MFSAAGILHWEWYQMLLVLFLIVFLLPYSANKQIRFYGCYIFYVISVSTLGILFTPIFILRPRNIDNLRISGQIIKPVTKVVGIKWDLRNGHILEEDRGAVIVANHQSCFDILGMLCIWDVMKKCTAIARKEIFYVVPFGPVAWLAGLVYINRVDARAAYKQISQAARIIDEIKAKLWLFPEGTRNRKGNGILPFKKGAFRIAIDCQAPIIPIVYSPYYFIDSKAKTFDRGQMIMQVLEPIATKGMTLDDLDSLMEKTHNLMADTYSQLMKEVAQYKSLNQCKLAS